MREIYSLKIVNSKNVQKIKNSSTFNLRLHGQAASYVAWVLGQGHTGYDGPRASSLTKLS